MELLLIIIVYIGLAFISLHILSAESACTLVKKFATEEVFNVRGAAAFPQPTDVWAGAPAAGVVVGSSADAALTLHPSM